MSKLKKKPARVSFSNYAAAGYQRVSMEDLRATLALPPEIPTGLAAMRRKIANWKRKATKKKRPATGFEEILESPHRFVELLQEDDLISRPLIIFDKSCDEFFELKAAGVRKYNLMSLAGLEWLTVTREAEDWARSRRSGRRVRRDGRIL